VLEPVWLSVLGILGFCLVLAGVVVFLHWCTHKKGQKSPFSGKPLDSGERILYPTVQKVISFMMSLPQPENAVIDCSKACFCRETGRIFPHAKNAFGEISLKPNYMKHYYQGALVPWYKLDVIEQDELLSCQQDYAIFLQGGKLNSKALYADLRKKTLVGWCRVPETNMEIVVVKPPKKDK
jgi:hypothetical protein